MLRTFFKFLGNILLFFYLSISKMAYSDDFLELSNVILSSTCICKNDVTNIILTIKSLSEMAIEFVLFSLNTQM